LTRDSKFLIYAEEVKDMQISTIHSFAKSILKSLAHEIGYGTNIKLRGFKNVKQQIIQQLMNEFFGKESIDAFLKSNIRYYEFIATANDLWGEMERKGLSETEITSLDWGKAEYDSILAQRLFQYIFAHCENRINIIKQQENAITIGDLIRKLKDFTNDSNKITQLHANCHIFVDEFQDSDDVQIELLASLQKFLNYKLFVVGDIKQSIYRFRGADYRSFEELKKKTTPFKYEVTKDKVKQFAVIKNLLSNPQVTEVIHAGDAGREGELIVRNILRLTNARQPMKRLWRNGWRKLRADELISSTLCMILFRRLTTIPYL